MYDLEEMHVMYFKNDVYTHTHTHTHIYIYIYIYILLDPFELPYYFYRIRGELI